MSWHDMIRFMTWHDMTWRIMAWYDMVWHNFDSQLHHMTEHAHWTRNKNVTKCMFIQHVMSPESCHESCSMQVTQHAKSCMIWWSNKKYLESNGPVNSRSWLTCLRPMLILDHVHHCCKIHRWTACFLDHNYVKTSSDIGTWSRRSIFIVIKHNVM